ncbi:uncharacterized protein LOC118462914 [Anopheles albimanus]|nr:uncharacterized protein LOC118462914 [Anopheles albimanus]
MKIGPVKVGEEVGKRNVVLRLPRETDTQRMLTAIRSCLPENTKVQLTTDRGTVSISNIDPNASEEDVTAALQKIAGPDTVMSVELRTRVDKTKRAVVQMETMAAMRAVGKLVYIGWTRCRIQRSEPVPIEMARCYKCLECGHHARWCRNEDRKGRCLQCGETGHNAAQCKADPKCMTCDGAHRTGSRMCSGKPQSQHS